MAEESLVLRPADECRWDLVAAGEVMLRLDPGEGRILVNSEWPINKGCPLCA